MHIFFHLMLLFWFHLEYFDRWTAGLRIFILVPVVIDTSVNISAFRLVARIFSSCLFECVAIDWRSRCSITLSSGVDKCV